MDLEITATINPPHDTGLPVLTLTPKGVSIEPSVADQYGETPAPIIVPWGSIGRFREMLEKAETTGHLLDLYD
jgi:hypothetical protein